VDTRDLEGMFLKLSKLQKGKCQYTDTSNAERLLERYGRDIRYCTPWKRWLYWDGRQWRKDAAAEIMARAKEIVREMYEEAYSIEGEWERDQLEKHAMKSEAVRRRKAMVEALSWERPVWVAPEELDCDAWLLNCGNGTVDLRTGMLRPHDRGDYITKIANADYVPGAECPRWRRFIGEAMGGNVALVSFLQRAGGWALTGDTTEQMLFVLHGGGANGKSTFINTMLNLLGDYGVAAASETFMRRRGQEMSNDVARLKGARLVATSEGAEGSCLSEHLVKQMTGNDRVTARFLYGEYFDFEPTFKIFIATNHRPVIEGMDDAIWRRIKLVPFAVTIPPERQDKNLMNSLREEYSGILNWFVEGCLKWQREGLETPPAVEEATRAYRSEMDVVGSFIRDRCEVREGAEARSRELFNEYASWCEENRERAGSERLLAFRLQDLGYVKQRRKDANYWVGIGLSPSAGCS